MTSKLLSKSDIGGIIEQLGLNNILDELIQTLEEGFKSLDSNQAIIPPRSGIHYRDPKLGLIEWMPASINKGLATLKLVGYHPSNPQELDLPTVISSICIFETSSGHLKSILDGTFLTALRTGAMSAVASQALADPLSSTLGIIGCGAQAVTQTHALSRIFPIEEIIAWDTDPQALNSLEERLAFTGIRIRKIREEELLQLLKESDILCTCTSEDPSSGALFEDFQNKPHLHINAVGSDFPGKFEIPLSLLKRSVVVPDFLSQAIAEGECQQLEAKQIADELGVTLQNSDEFSKLQQRLTVFDSTGHAFADYLTSLLFLSYAERLKLGTEIELECIPQDPKDPYSFLGTSLAKTPSTSANLAKG